MSTRNLAILAALVVALLLLIALGQRSNAPTSTGGGPLVPGLTELLEQVERVSVTTAGNQTVATIERGPESWKVTNKSGYGANVAKLRQSLQNLAEARILEQKTANPELYSRLGVEDVEAPEAAGVKVTVSSADKDLAAIIFGNPEGTKYRYVRRVGEAQSYLIDRNPDFSRNVGQWLDALIIDIRSDRIREVTVKHPDGEVLSISKASKDDSNYAVANVPKGRELLYPGVANVIGNSLRELNLEDVEKAAESDSSDQATVVEFTTFDGLTVRAVGVKRGDEGWVTFQALANPNQPAPSSTEPGSESAAGTDPAAEAERINAKLGGWRYRIASFQYEQMTRRMSDLLKPPG